ncbi:MAG TPA: YihY/virulence factor BrkB family protein [Verrucomicrobiae bacterium]|jgi:membrane protein|nr:YihY/virulence factor BrkB family protein [Verrucomicrobiae bacterium]
MKKRTNLFRDIIGLCKETFSAWVGINTPRLGASLAYYTVFAIAPLFLIVLRVAGIWFGQEAAQHELFGQVQQLLGKAGATAIESMVTSASNQASAGRWATLIAIVTLGVGVTGVFVELQDALNTVWQVKRASGHGVRQFIKDRLLSFGVVIGIGFLLLVSLVLSAGLAGVGKYVQGLMPSEHFFWSTVNFVVSLGVITVLFSMIFKVLPDVKMAWRDVWVGGFITAVLFNLGKFVLGLYLGRSSVTSAYGAAGSLVIILMWVYYSAQILFFGAQFTRVYANKYGSKMQPVAGAQLVDATADRKLPARAAAH